jgi:CIC family chloride channel protein
MTGGVAFAYYEGVWLRFVEWFNRRELSENSILLAFAVVIGAGSALGVVAFYNAIDLAYMVFYEIPSRYLPRMNLLAYRPLITAGSIAAAWFVMRRVAPGHEGSTVPDVQVAVARRGSRIPFMPVFARTAASAITLGGGGSAGSEGPVAVLGSALGSWLGRVFHFDSQRVKILVASGAAAAISAAFNAPLAGAFFALEEILGSFAVGSFPPVVVASVIGAVVSRGFFGNHPAFPIPEQYGYTSAREILLFYPILGVVCGLVSVLFVRTYFGTASVIQRIRIPSAVLPWLTGAVVGGMVWLSQGLLVGHGHLSMRIDLFGRMPWYFLGALAIGKILATSITLNGGGSGGLFTPSLYVGAVTGGAVGALLTDAFPSLTIHPEAYAVVGMGAVVAAATAAPITGILIVFEMTNDYAIMLPLMLATAITYMLARHLEHDSLYSGWLRRRGEHLQQGTSTDVLAGLFVADVVDRKPITIDEDAPLATMIGTAERTRDFDVAVVSADRRLVGMISIVELARIAQTAADAGSLVIASDVAMPVTPVRPDASLLDAIRQMGVRGSATLPVIDPDTGEFHGVVTRAHILAVYERTLMRRDAPAT